MRRRLQKKMNDLSSAQGKEKSTGKKKEKKERKKCNDDEVLFQL